MKKLMAAALFVMFGTSQSFAGAAIAKEIAVEQPTLSAPMTEDYGPGKTAVCEIVKGRYANTHDSISGDTITFHSAAHKDDGIFDKSKGPNIMFREVTLHILNTDYKLSGLVVGSSIQMRLRESGSHVDSAIFLVDKTPKQIQEGKSFDGLLIVQNKMVFNLHCTSK